MEAEKLKDFILGQGASEVGFSKPPDAPKGLDYAVTVVLKLSEYVISQINEKPTHAYFHHYRTVNAAIDNIILRTGLQIEAVGYRYFPVAASQSVKGLQGLYSHKTAARMAGLGFIGRNALFISNQFGCGVRLGTIFTDMPLLIEEISEPKSCGECNACVVACPAMAIKGVDFSPEIGRDAMLDALACSHYMKDKFQDIGRGSVCGICIKVCKYGKAD